ncbi:zinc finger CCCH domain-containing protein 6-like [Olea europaea var. sylvestris]|uniref:zinc finger CCCH domain-containing protein 6-like n=1 Tax=Olea europaea var. sylvestris TaxID=158386 RepID=UPI000C1CFBC7|nr:zinc finger CCCH domain-containing protein 6-like [Olea europaea var. sylvestris]
MFGEACEQWPVVIPKEELHLPFLKFKVRLFSSEESPSQVNSEALKSDDDFPPGFKRIQTPNLWRNKLSKIPLVKWRCPPQFVLDGAWQVVAGEESKELEAQTQREMRVIEAVYPHPSPIPPNLYAQVRVENTFVNDQNTLLIPITPIEDEDAELDTSTVDYMAPNPQVRLLAQGTSLSQGCGATTPRAQFPSTVTESDLVSAANAALTALMANSDLKELIDRNWLVKLLNDRKMIEQLTMNPRAASIVKNLPPSSLQNVLSSSLLNISSSRLQNIQAIGSQNIPSLCMQSMSSFSLHSLPSIGPPSMLNLSSLANNFYDPVPIVVSRGDPPSATPTRPFHHPHKIMGTVPSFCPSGANLLSGTPSASLGDPRTYKSLIRQHGGERQETLPHLCSQTTQESANTKKRRGEKSKMKPCIFFKSPMGCRDGVNCAFLHDTTSQQRVSSISDVPSSKRAKMD